MAPKLSTEELDELHEVFMEDYVPDDARPMEIARSDTDNMFLAWRDQRRNREIPENPPKWDLSSIVPDLEGLDNAEALKYKIDWLMDNAIGFSEDMVAKVEKINERAQKGRAPRPERILDVLDDVGVMMTHLQRIMVVSHLKTMEHHKDEKFHELEEHVGERLHEAMYRVQSIPAHFNIPVRVLQPVLQAEPQLMPLMRLLAGMERPDPNEFKSLSQQKEEDQASDERLSDFSQIFGQLNSDKEFEATRKANQKESLLELSDERRKELKEEEGYDVDKALEELKDVPALSTADKDRIEQRYTDTAMKMVNARFFQVWKNAERFGVTPAIITSKEQGLPTHFVDDMIPNLSSILDMEGFMQAASDARNGRERPDSPPKFEREIPWREAVDIVVTAFAKIHPELGETALDAFKDNWIHATDNPEKFYNPFSVGGQPVSVWAGNHPVVLLNYDGSMDNLATLAHEMGHALAEYLSGEFTPNPMSHISSTSLHETFAHFSANMALNELVERCEDPEEKAAVRNYQHNHSTAIFLNNGMNGIEYALLAATKGGHKVTAEDVGNIVRQELAAISPTDEGKERVADISDKQAVEMISHSAHMFLSSQPYYNINYAFAEMGAMNLEQRFNELQGEEREAFAEKWLEVITNARDLNYGAAMKHLDIEVEAPKDMLETAQAIIKDRIVSYAKHTVEYMYPEDVEAGKQDGAEQTPTFLERLRAAREERKQQAQGEADASTTENGQDNDASHRSRFQRSQTGVNIRR